MQRLEPRQQHLVRRWMVELGNPCDHQDHAISQHQDAAEEPDRQLGRFNFTFAFVHHPTLYQKIRFKIKKTTITTVAQKIGFCQIVVAPSCGIGVTPYTSPESCATGTGFVIRLTTTVTPTQMIQLHNARYKFSAIGFASGLIAM